MKKNIFLIGVCALMLGLTSCEDFLNRPTEDNYNADNYYATDEACRSGVNYLYNSPWYDFQRGFIKVGEVLSGNIYWGDGCPYLNFSMNGTDQDLVNMSYSLWAEIAHCSTVYESIKKAEGPSEKVKNACMGEALTLKALAYFFLVRSFGDVPIIHSNSATLAEGNYNELLKVEKADVYEYIIVTLEEAMKLLPESNEAGRIDYYCAEGLLSKVYLTKAGVSGTLNNEDLAMAEKYSLDVIENSGRSLEENYEDVFRGSHNCGPESLIAWRWTVGAHWTCQNTFESDLAIEGFAEVGSIWGGWNGPSADLMEAFGVFKIEGEGAEATLVDGSFESPATRADLDSRRKATLMLAGDVYPYFWRDKGGFDYLKFIYDTEYNPSATGELQGPCGSNHVKHLYGDAADHVAEMGCSDARMASALATHVLRLSDVYLVHAEACVLQGKGGQASALAAYNAVHKRAVKSATDATSLDFDMVWKERRLELAIEGDRWYDFVRRSYYDMPACIEEIKAQHRNQVWNVDGLYKNYFESQAWKMEVSSGTYVSYNNTVDAPNITENSFSLPFPSEDVALNKNLLEAPIHVDVRATYKY